MKVTHLISGSEGGGSRFQVLNLLEELSAGSQVEVELLSLMEGPLTEDARSRGLPMEIFPMNNIGDFSVIKPLLRHLAYTSPDIIHTHGVRANFIGRLVYKFMATDLKPVLFTTVHSSIYHDYKNSWKRFIYPPLEKSLRGDVSQFIAVSKGLYRELQDDGIAEDRLSVIPNGIYPENYLKSDDLNNDDLNNDDCNLRRELGISKDAGVMLSVGRLMPVKGHSYLLSAFSKLLQRSGYSNAEQNLYLVLVGDGPEAEKLRQQAEDLSIAEYVVFTGYRKDVPDFLQMADLFVLPSLMEGMPIILLEAMAAGLPILASDVGGISEVVIDGESAMLIPSADDEALADSLENLWKSPELRQQLGTQARITVMEKYHFNRVVEETTQLYNKFKLR